MQLKTIYNQNQLRDYSSLFSRSEAQLWMRNEFNSINCKIDRYDKNWQDLDRVTYFDYLKYVYRILESHYQNEYILKNSFLNEWLIKEIGHTNSKVFSEFRVGNAVADLVMFNGNSKAFEIKTEFDSDSRLALQIDNYRKAFNQIFLIIPESKLSLYEKYDKGVGLITFKGNQLQKFTFHRSAESNPVVDAKTLMNILRTHEYKAIVKLYYGDLPEMTSFNQFNKCFELIEKIPNSELNIYFIEQMKSRNIDRILSSRYYRELNQLSLALKLSKVEKETMIQKLKSPLKT
jgi:hypothetical protein